MISRRDFTKRDFTSVNDKIREYLRTNFPDIYQNIRESDLVSVLIELISVVSDLLAFQIDYSFNEMQFDTVSQVDHLFSFAKLVGFPMLGSKASTVVLKGVVKNRPGINYKLIFFGIDTIDEEPFSASSGDITFTVINQTEIYPTPDPNNPNQDIFEIELKQVFLNTDLFYSDGDAFQIFISSVGDIASNVPIYVAVGSEKGFWTEVSSLWLDIKASEVYQTEFIEDFKMKVSFGDGTHGKVPLVAQPIYLYSWTTKGLDGQISASDLTFSDSIPYEMGSASGYLDVDFTNLQPSYGATSHESLDEIKSKITAWVKTPDRLVTLADYENYIKYQDGILKAYAVYDSSHFEVDLYVVLTDYLSVLSDTVRQSYQSDMLERSVLYVRSVKVKDAYLRSLRLTLNVTIESGYTDENVRYNIEEFIMNLLMPVGYCEREMGEGLTRDDVIYAVRQVEGVRKVSLIELTLKPYYEVIRWSLSLDTIDFDNFDITPDTVQEVWTLKMISSTDFSMKGSVFGDSDDGKLGVHYSNNYLSFTLNVTGGNPPQIDNEIKIYVFPKLADIEISPDSFLVWDKEHDDKFLTVVYS